MALGGSGPLRVEIQIDARDNTAAGVASALRRVDLMREHAERMVRAQGGGRVAIRVDDRGAANALGRMRVTVGELTGRTHMIRVGADTRAAQQQIGMLSRVMQNIRLSNVSASVRDPIGAAANAMMAVSRLAGPAGFAIGGVTVAVYGLSAAFDQLVAAPLRFHESLQRMSIGMETVFVRQLGRTRAEADAFNKSITEFAIKTPFLTEQALGAASTLLARGFQPEAIIGAGGRGGLMEILGDISSVTQNPNETFRRVALAWGQMNQSMRIDAQDMNQLVEAGLSAWKYLDEFVRAPLEAGGMGMTGAVQGVGRQMAENNQLPAKRALEFIIRRAGEDRRGAMARVMQEQVGGQLAQITDTFRIRFIDRMGKGIQQGLLPGLQGMVRWLENNEKALGRLGDTAERFGLIIGKVFSAPMGFVGLFGGAGNPLENFVANIDTWWVGGGEDQMRHTLTGIGTSMGEMVGGTLRALMGVGTESGDKGLFFEIAREAANAFGTGFMAGLDDMDLGRQLNAYFTPEWSTQTWTLPNGMSITLPDVKFGGAEAASRIARQNTGMTHGPPAPGSVDEAVARATVQTGAPTTASAGAFGSYTGAAVNAPSSTGGDITVRQFGNLVLAKEMAAAGFTQAEIEAACGPLAAAAVARSHGINMGNAQAFGMAKKAGLWANGEMQGPGAYRQLLENMGLDASIISREEGLKRIGAGTPTTISTPRHYFTGQRMQDGSIFVGASGLGIKGGSEVMSLAEIERLGGGAATFIGTQGRVGGPKTQNSIAGPTDYRAMARQAAMRHGIDPDLFERQIAAESSFNPTARSGAGALGIAQFMPGTAAALGIDPMDPAAALDASAMYMADMTRRHGSYEKALRGYNAGEGRIEESREFPETNSYVEKIMGGMTISTGDINFPMLSASNMDQATAQAFAKQFVDHVMYESAERLAQVRQNRVPAE